MWSEQLVVDADSHIMEPPSMWREYVDPPYRDSAMRVERDAERGDQLVIAGQQSRIIPRLGGVAYSPDSPVRDWNTLVRPTEGFASYEESVTPDAWDGGERLRWMDGTGIDRSIVFPSLGLIWPRETDPSGEWATAHFAAYNRWVRDFASANRGRLVPAAQIGHRSAELDAQEVKALAGDGFSHIMLPMGATVTDDLDGFFGAVQEYDLTVHLHKVAIPHNLSCPSPTSLHVPGADPFFNHVTETLPGQLLLTALLASGIADRFPDVRMVFHECNAGWLPAWLDRATESYEVVAGRTKLVNPPSHYVLERDTFFFSVGLGERLDLIPDSFGGRLLMATDHPHPGTPEAPQEEWAEVADLLTPERWAAVVGGNGKRILGDEK